MNAEKKIHKTDFLVIGSGIAGLSFALKIATHFKDASITIKLLIHLNNTLKTL